MNEQLYPCPFCGGPADVDRTMERFEYSVGGPNSVKEYGYYTYCTQCDASVGLINVPPADRAAAIDEWNRRAPIDMPHPDLTAAPEWARWWAVDPNGHAYWYEVEPILCITVDYSGWRSATIEGVQCGEFEFAREVDIPLGCDWRQLKQQHVGGPGSGEVSA